jgi:hypothetical protein
MLRFKNEQAALEAIRAAGCRVTKQGAVWHVRGRRIDIATVDLLMIRPHELAYELGRLTADTEDTPTNRRD